MPTRFANIETECERRGRFGKIKFAAKVTVFGGGRSEKETHAISSSLQAEEADLGG
jgi:hypothetical protein